ncbi:zinc finger protein 70-like [Ptychodera flava]|uniref:zinc finger protein 70-like n=1 Tax=Ptychodera flava TaxID=63121 RepID=UPI00396AAD24
MELSSNLSAGRIFRPTIVYQCPDLHVAQAPLPRTFPSTCGMFLCSGLQAPLESPSAWWARSPESVYGMRSDYYDPPSYITCNMCLPRFVSDISLSKVELSSRSNHQHVGLPPPFHHRAPPGGKNLPLFGSGLSLGAGNMLPSGENKSDTLERLKEFVSHSQSSEPISITEIAAGDALEESKRCREEKKLTEKKRRFPCPLCDVSCSNNGQLRGHIRVHTGERPFKCDHPTCGRAFARNEELTRHRRIHTGMRPHRCSICEKRFGRKDHLTKHIKTHLKPAEKKTYVCSLFGCGQKYSRSDALARHQWTAHSIKPKSNCRKKGTSQG